MEVKHPVLFELRMAPFLYPSLVSRIKVVLNECKDREIISELCWYCKVRALELESEIRKFQDPKTIQQTWFAQRIQFDLDMIKTWGEKPDMV
jgi:hypothetical protein